MDNLSDRQRKLLEAIDSIEAASHAKSTERAPGEQETLDYEIEKDIEVYRKIESIFEKIRRPGDMPKKIGRFKIKKWLGSGTFGAVYLAEDPKLGDVAIKIPHQGRFIKHEDRDRFLEEAANTRRLEHPRIVPIYECGLDDDGTPYMVLRYLPESLESRLEENVYEANEAVDVMVHVAAAMQHAHSEDFYHRDLKPANILLDSQGVPKVVDFGLAVTSETQIGMAGQFAGTPAYMSPEQIRGQVDDLDGRTDIWAMGVILYQMVTGKHPFWRTEVDVCDRVEDCKRRILEHDPKPVRQVRDDIPDEFQVIINRCLARSPRERYDCADDLKEDLIEFSIRDIEAFGKARKFYRQKVIKHLQERGFLQYKTSELHGEELASSSSYSLSEPLSVSPEIDFSISRDVRDVRDAIDALPLEDIDSDRGGASKGCLLVIFISLVILFALGFFWWVGSGDSSNRPVAANLPQPLVTASNLVFVQPSPTIELDAQFTTDQGEHWQEFTSGSTLAGSDWYRLRFRSKDGAYFYVWQYDTRGNVCWLYPRNDQCVFSEGENPCPADTWIQLPAGNEALYLDDAVGIEQIFVVATPERARDLVADLAQHVGTKGEKISQPFSITTRGVGGKVRLGQSGSVDRWIKHIEGERGVVFESIWFKHVE